MFPEATWIVGFFIGTAIGSFLNVIIYRMPRGLPLYDPAYSFCPSCKTPLGLADLMPLFSWLFSKGRCRHCAEKVSPRYFFVEMMCGIAFAGVWWNTLIVGQDPARAFAYSFAVATLIAIIWIDLEFYIIPDEINAFLWFFGIMLNAWWFVQRSPETMTWGMPTSLAGWLTGVLVLWGIAFLGRVLFRKDAMGHGDIKMARGIGAILGPIPAIFSFALAIVLGAVFGIFQILARRNEPEEPGADEEESEEIPPEPIGSLIKSGLGYVLCIDIVGLFVPKLYERWFGESPYIVEEVEDDFEVGQTMIPFGPYLALGAILAVLFQAQLLGYWDEYLRWIMAKD